MHISVSFAEEDSRVTVSLDDGKRGFFIYTGEDSGGVLRENGFKTKAESQTSKQNLENFLLSNSEHLVEPGKVWQKIIEEDRFRSFLGNWIRTN